ncbi:hypothetical protein [Polynucleobacter sp. MG-27-Goln-C1]|uniref:hypothetical protein n=1 Tax=Polynucleobacter sp. MG-27-Goln-C1 TaxID=1819726 RepID=UPI001C0E5669|nr:hypothetical protein [Polynucleobacter sp. MG-27-Goln-C1]MBU3611455.1 hypothetical protein [Polynucleobacter sp. MG-27-Goln-C1]
MTDKSNPEHLEKVETEKPTSLTDDSINGLGNTDSCTTEGEKHGANRPTNAAKSKREIMEELSRERFPWEE